MCVCVCVRVCEECGELLKAYMHVCVCVYVCEYEKDNVSERESVCVCVCVCIYVVKEQRHSSTALYVKHIQYTL